MTRTSQGLIVLAGWLAVAPAAGQPSARTDSHGDPLPPGAIARLGTVRFREAGLMSCLAFAPDGKTLATSGGPNSADVVIWDAASGKQLRRLPGGEAAISVLTYSPDGRRLASSGVVHPDCTLVWDVTTGGLRGQFEGSRPAFTPDGKRVSTVRRRGFGVYEVAVWNADTGQLLRTLPVPASSRDVVPSPDGQAVALVNSGGANITLWDLTEGKAVRTLAAGPAPGSLVFTPDGTSVAFSEIPTQAPPGSGVVVRVWDLTTGKLRTQADGTLRAQALACSADGKSLAWAGWGAHVYLGRLDGGRPPLTLGYRGEFVSALAFSPDGKRLAAAAGPTIRLWNVATGSEIRLAQGHVWEPRGPAVFTPDGRGLVTSANDATVVWDLTTKRERLRLENGLAGGTEQYDVSADGRSLLTCGDDGKVSILDLSNGKTRCVLRGLVGGNAAAFAPDGRTVAVGEAGGGIDLYDAEGGERLRPLVRASGREGEECLDLAFSPCGKALFYVVRGGAQYPVRLIEVPGGRRQFPFGRPGLPLRNRPRFSPDGKTLAVSVDDVGIRLWDMAEGRELPTVPAPGAYSVAFPREGRYLAAVVGGGRRDEGDHVMLWDRVRGVKLSHFGRLQGPVLYARFSPDGRTLATVSNEQGVRLWEMLTGGERGRQGEGTAGLAPEGSGPQFSPDGRILLTGHTTALLLWDMTGRAPDGRLQQARLTDEQSRTAWADLGSADSARAYRAIWALVAAGEQSVAWIGRHLRPAEAPPPGRVEALIEQLSAPRLGERRAAEATLETLGEEAGLALVKALRAAPPLEAKRRIEQALDRLTGAVVAQPWLQALRAVEVLEHIGGAEARRELARLAAGEPRSRLTQDAVESLRRLDQRGR